MSEETPRHELTWPESGVRMAFRRIPNGEFRMGSRDRFEEWYGPREHPAHKVRIHKEFWLGETVVPVASIVLVPQPKTLVLRHGDGVGGRNRVRIRQREAGLVD